MAIRCLIGNESGSVINISFVDTGGEPGVTGRELLKRYNSRKKASALVKIGNRHHIYDDVGVPGYDVFTTFPYKEYQKFLDNRLNSIEKYANEIEADYVYIFDDSLNEWLICIFDDGEWYSLQDSWNYVKGFR